MCAAMIAFKIKTNQVKSAARAMQCTIWIVSVHWKVFLHQSKPFLRIGIFFLHIGKFFKHFCTLQNNSAAWKTFIALYWATGKALGVEGSVCRAISTRKAAYGSPGDLQQVIKNVFSSLQRFFARRKFFTFTLQSFLGQCELFYTLQ